MSDLLARGYGFRQAIQNARMSKDRATQCIRDCALSEQNDDRSVAQYLLGVEDHFMARCVALCAGLMTRDAFVEKTNMPLSRVTGVVSCLVPEYEGMQRKAARGATTPDRPGAQSRVSRELLARHAIVDLLALCIANQMSLTAVAAGLGGTVEDLREQVLDKCNFSQSEFIDAMSRARSKVNESNDVIVGRMHKGELTKEEYLLDYVDSPDGYNARAKKYCEDNGVSRKDLAQALTRSAGAYEPRAKGVTPPATRPRLCDGPRTLKPLSSNRPIDWSVATQSDFDYLVHERRFKKKDLVAVSLDPKNEQFLGSCDRVKWQSVGVTGHDQQRVVDNEARVVAKRVARLIETGVLSFNDVSLLFHIPREVVKASLRSELGRLSGLGAPHDAKLGEPPFVNLSIDAVIDSIKNCCQSGLSFTYVAARRFGIPRGELIDWLYKNGVDITSYDIPELDERATITRLINSGAFKREVDLWLDNRLGAYTDDIGYFMHAYGVTREQLAQADARLTSQSPEIKRKMYSKSSGTRSKSWFEEYGALGLYHGDLTWDNMHLFVARNGAEVRYIADELGIPAAVIRAEIADRLGRDPVMTRESRSEYYDAWHAFFENERGIYDDLELYFGGLISRDELFSKYGSIMLQYPREFLNTRYDLVDVSRKATGGLAARARSLNRFAQLTSGTLFENSFDASFYVPARSEGGQESSQKRIDVMRAHNLQAIRDALGVYKSVVGKQDVYPDSYTAKVFGWLNASLHRNIALLEGEGLLDVDWERAKLTDVELKVLSVLDDAGVRVIPHDRRTLRNPRTGNVIEIDLYLPDLNIGIETSPSYWHNSNEYRLGANTNARPRNSHYDKYRASVNSGVRLIQLFDWDLSEPQWSRVTKPRLESLAGGADRRIFARDTYVTQIPAREAREFCDATHSDGYQRARYKLGLFTKSNDELVGVMTAGQSLVPSYKKRGWLDIKRMSFKQGVLVVGGVSKLTKHMSAIARADGFDALMTYSDNAWGHGMGYEKAGFELVKDTGPRLIFTARNNACDTYSWSIDSPWGARSGVVGDDRARRGLPSYEDEPFNIREYIENELTHRDGGGHGYDAVYTPGSRLWVKSV